MVPSFPFIIFYEASIESNEQDHDTLLASRASTTIRRCSPSFPPEIVEHDVTAATRAAIASRSAVGFSE
jgi:hypothetical protein